MIRRLKKVTSQAELQQLIEAGIIASPYIAFDSSSNVTNMVLPAEREISEIEYEQEVSSPVKLVGAITPEYYVQEGYTACRLSFEINAEYIDSHDYVLLLMCQKSYFDNALANSAVSKEEFISTILLDAYYNNPKTLSFAYAYAVKFNLRSAFPFNTDVPCIVSEENMAGDDLIWVPYGDEYPTDNTYYLFYGYRPTGEEEFDMVGEVAQYRVMPYLSDDSNFVFDGMNLISYEKLDPDTGESMGQYRNFEARVPGNTVYDRARYAWYLDGESDTEALENGRTATCDATTTFAFEDYDAPEYINETGQTLEGFIAVQLYNSVTGAESKVKNFSTMYVEPSGGDEPVWNSPQLVPNMYTADPSNGEYTDASGNFDIYYADDEREGWKYIDSLYFYLNSQYLEGWGSTAEFIENNTVGGSNTPLVFITEKSALDAAVEYYSNSIGHSESFTLSHLVYDAVNEGRELSYGDGTTQTWPCGFNDGTETSFWGEDIEYLNNDVVSLGGFNYMQPDNDRTPKYYILVAYQKEDESLRASNENILRAPADYESMYKVYKAGIFRAYDYSEEGDDTPDASVYSTAYISSFEADPQQEWTDENSNVHAMLTPIIEMTNNDASMNYFQLGMYDAAEEGNAWDPIENLYEWACENSYVELSSVFNGETSASFNAGAYMNIDSYQQANDGDTYKFVGRYVNGYTQNTTDEWGNQYEELVISESKPWIILGQYPEPGPEVMFDSDSDDGRGTITFNAYLNTQADDAGMYYKVALTSNSDWDAFVAKEGANADYNDYLMTCLEEDVYTGTEDNPDSITANYPTPSEGIYSGDVDVVLFDDQDEIVSYWTVRGWVWPSM